MHASRSVHILAARHKGDIMWICLRFSHLSSKLLPATVVVCQEDANGVFVKRGFCTLPKTGGFDENGDNDECAFCPRKQGVCSPAPEKDKNDENGACHACTGSVCRKPCLYALSLGPSGPKSKKKSENEFPGQWHPKIRNGVRRPPDYCPHRNDYNLNS